MVKLKTEAEFCVTRHIRSKQASSISWDWSQKYCNWPKENVTHRDKSRNYLLLHCRVWCREGGGDSEWSNSQPSAKLGRSWETPRCSGWLSGPVSKPALISHGQRLSTKEEESQSKSVWSIMNGTRSCQCLRSVSNQQILGRVRCGVLPLRQNPLPTLATLDECEWMSSGGLGAWLLTKGKRRVKQQNLFRLPGRDPTKVPQTMRKGSSGQDWLSGRNTRRATGVNWLSAQSWKSL